MAALVGVLMLWAVLVTSGLCGACDPDTVMEELARAAYSSPGVFEGRLEAVTRPSNGSPKFNATFLFRKALKGNFKIVEKSQPRPLVIVALRSYGADKADCLEGVDGGDSLSTSKQYLVFVNRSVVSNQSVDGKPAVLYQMTKFPQLSTKLNVEKVQAYSSPKCGKINVRISPKQSKVRQGQKLTLKCQPSGKPTERFAWFKESLPLVVNERINISLVKRDSVLLINNMTSEDSGKYQCQATNVVAASKLASTVVRVEAADANGHTVPCPRQDYCLNGGTCLILQSLGRRFCKCAGDFVGVRCQEKRLPPFYRTKIPAKGAMEQWPVGTETTLIISGIAIGTLLLACFVITVFCVARNKCVKKNSDGLRRNNSDHRPPSLPDGSAFNVVQLNAAITERALALSTANDGTSLIFNNARQQPSSDYDLPLLRRDHRMSGMSAPNNGNRSSFGNRGSGQIRLSMISTASGSQVLRSRLPAISATPVSDRQEPGLLQPVNADEEHIPMLRQEDSGIKASDERPGESAGAGAASPRSSQCSHTESLICDATKDDNLCSSVAGTEYCELQPCRVSLDRRMTSTDGDSDISEPFDGGVDLEVNFESEADVLAVETGDELDRVGTSHDFSEMSSQVTTERGSSDEDGSIPSGSDDVFNRHRLLRYAGVGTSSGDLSWDESADLPSFAVPSVAVVSPLQFGKR